MSRTATRKFTPAARDAWRETKRAEAAAVLASVIEMFATGELPELVAQTMIVRAEGSSPISRWSITNQLLAIKAGTTDARGYKQWAEVGRVVKRGHRAFRILGPVLATVEKTGENGAVTEERKLVGYKPIPVFRLQDTEGDDLPNLNPVELPPLQDAARSLGLTINYLPSHELAAFSGYYHPATGEIALLTHDVSVFFHELAHAAHDRVLRAEGKTIASVPAADAEVVAETVAATLCSLYGHDGFVYHGARYVAGWANENPGRAAVRVLGDIQKTLHLILDQEGTTHG